MVLIIYYFIIKINLKCRRRNPTPKIVFSKTRFYRFLEKGVREPVRGRRELVSHHGATGGGVRGPKMRHLVLYKLAGFFPTDWQPIGRELCPQKVGQKWGFLGSRESRASGAASCENRSQSLTPRWPHRHT